MAFGFVVAARQGFAANFTACRDRILAGLTRRRRFDVSIYSSSSSFSISTDILQRRLATGTSFHRLWQPRTSPAISRMAALDAAMGFDAAAQRFAANAVA